MKKSPICFNILNYLSKNNWKINSLKQFIWIKDLSKTFFKNVKQKSFRNKFIFKIQKK